MSSFRDVNNNDILKKWYIGMEEMYLGIMNEQDKENDLETDELFDKLLNSITKNKLICHYIVLNDSNCTY